MTLRIKSTRCNVFSSKFQPTNTSSLFAVLLKILISNPTLRSTQAFVWLCVLLHMFSSNNAKSRQTHTIYDDNVPTQICTPEVVLQFGSTTSHTHSVHALSSQTQQSVARRDYLNRLHINRIYDLMHMQFPKLCIHTEGRWIMQCYFHNEH